MTICFLKFWMFDLCFVTKHMFFGKFKFWRKTMQLNTKTNEIIKCWVVVYTYIYIFLKHARVFNNLKFWKRKMSTHAQSISIFVKFISFEMLKNKNNMPIWHFENVKLWKHQKQNKHITKYLKFGILKVWKCVVIFEKTNKRNSNKLNIC